GMGGGACCSRVHGGRGNRDGLRVAGWPRLGRAVRDAARVWARTGVRCGWSARCAEVVEGCALSRCYPGRRTRCRSPRCPIRSPDPEPCGACARGEFDRCRNGRYTERGIKQLDGYASQQWSVEPQYAVRLDPRMAQVGMLLEPASVLAKAWEQIERIASRAWW